MLLVGVTNFPIPHSLFSFPQGALAVAAGLRRHLPDVETRILDWNDAHFRDANEVFDSYLRGFRPAVVGFSVYSFFVPNALRLAQRVRAWDPQVPVVVGGTHATAFPDSVEHLAEVDHFVVGEGIEVFPQLVRSLMDGSPLLKDVPSVTFRSSGRLTRTGIHNPPESLDQYPPVCWDDLELADYQHNTVVVDGDYGVMSHSRPFVPYRASAGCGFKCRFCERPSGSVYRYHSPERVVEDLGEIRARISPDSFVLLTDECVNLDRQWMSSLLRELEAFNKDGRMIFGSMARADLLDHDTVDRMIQAGFGYIATFPESGSKRIRELMGKRMNLEKLARVLHYASEQGAVTTASFLLGWPGETKEDAAATFALARDPAIDFLFFNALIYFGATAVGRDFLPQCGIEINSSEYFETLLDPCRINLTEYDDDTYVAYLNQGRRMMLERILQPKTAASLDRWGLSVVRWSTDVLGRPDIERIDVADELAELETRPEAPVAESPSPTVGREERIDLVSAPGRVEEKATSQPLLAVLKSILTTKETGVVTGCSFFNRGADERDPAELGLRLDVDRSGCRICVVLEPRSERPCYLRTHLFNVSYPSVQESFGPAEKALFRALVDRIVLLERSGLRKGLEQARQSHR